VFLLRATLAFLALPAPFGLAIPWLLAAGDPIDHR